MLRMQNWQPPEEKDVTVVVVKATRMVMMRRDGGHGGIRLVHTRMSLVGMMMIMMMIMMTTIPVVWCSSLPAKQHSQPSSAARHKKPTSPATTTTTTTAAAAAAAAGPRGGSKEHQTDAYEEDDDEEDEEEEDNEEQDDSENDINNSNSNQKNSVIRDEHKLSPSEFRHCVDLRQGCAEWARLGQCQQDPLYTHAHCPRSCQVCHNRTRTVPIQQAFGIKPLHSVKDTHYDVGDAIGSDIGTPQVIMPGNRSAVFRAVHEARKYISNEIMTDPRYASVRDICRNKDPFCAHRAALLDHCNSRDQDIAVYMIYNCAPICFTCRFLSPKALCPIDPGVKNAWYKGDLNAMFERIVNNPDYQHYNINVLSRPGLAPYDTSHNATYHVGGPWLLRLDNFFDAKVADRLIALGTEAGYQRSIGGISHPDGTLSQITGGQRTSSNTWCTSQACKDDPLVQALLGRMEDLTGIPSVNGEYLQLLKYEPGEYYTQHNDMIPHDIEHMQGVRILTIFLYLSDVEEGGGTQFPYLNLTIQPKRGRAVMWPSVLNEDPHKVDSRTDHVALPLIRGLKYAANTWFHQRDFKGPESEGCLMDNTMQEQIEMFSNMKSTW